MLTDRRRGLDPALATVCAVRPAPTDVSATRHLIPSQLTHHPAFAPYANAHGLYQEIVNGRAAPPPDVPVFVSPPPRTVSAIDYERRVVEDNALIVRADNLHDVMNALVWLTFPKTKRAISEAHVALGVTANATPHSRAALHRRPRRRDVLTLFDEAGAIILSQRDDLKKLHEGHLWRELFVSHRDEFINEARPILFGHGALEQLSSHPHRGLTVKALWLPLAHDTPLIDVDDWMASHIASVKLLAENEHRLPLPIAGVPGWFAENERADCYDDAAVFRPLRAMKSA